ncbi:MAG TPA: PQQ-dependent sugar dehydrogenase [Gemmatimonadales bacterium]|nr:PQQ-dependent sugar dehydrogenase [Gemmatimonadales bacterium]
MRTPRRRSLLGGLARDLACGIAVALALPGAAAGQGRPAAGARPGPPCAADDGGLALADGFCARLVARNLGAVRQLAVAPDGTLYAALSRGSAFTGKQELTSSIGGVLAFRDANGDGDFDERAAFGPGPGNAVAVVDGHLYFALRDRIVRWRLTPGRLEPVGDPETIVRDLPADGDHYAKAIAFGPGSTLYVSVASASNSCQKVNRLSASPGRDPCPELARRAGIWRFDRNRPGQTEADGTRFATGIRNGSAIAVRPGTDELWVAMNGRDQLSQSWGFSDQVNAENPGEELLLVRPGQDYGWPYCYWSVQYGRKVLAPEYGGDGKSVGRCARAADPVMVFPAHWAPLALAFGPGPASGLDTGGQGGLFVAMHGSWNRAPLPQAGYRVVYVPFANGRPTGRFVTFAASADGATGLRAAGVAVAPDGSVYISDDNAGKIWRVWRRGNQGPGTRD